MEACDAPNFQAVLSSSEPRRQSGGMEEENNNKKVKFLFFIYLFFNFYFLGLHLPAHESSLARDQIGATAGGLRYSDSHSHSHSHSHAESKLCLGPTP